MTSRATDRPPHAPLSERRHFLLTSFGVAAGALVGACGGSDSDAPSITLAAIPTSGVVGATITLSATADDDESVTEVRFYRIGTNSEELLATFDASPYLFQTTIPTGATDSVTYRATAVDDDDQEVDSNEVIVTVTT
jgi:Bacterial Ig domain